MLAFYLSALESQQEKNRFRDIYEQQYKLMYYVAMGILKNHDQAEDAVQGTFFAMLKNKEKLFSIPCREIPNWCVSIVKGKCIDIVRQQKHFSDTPIDDMAEYLEDNASPVELQVITKMEYERMRHYLTQLDTLSQQILNMHYALKLSIKDIAAELNMKEKTVEMRIYRAKNKVREQLEAERS